MSFLNTEIPSPRQAVKALRKPRVSSPQTTRARKPKRAPRMGGRTIVGLDIEPGFIAAVETLPGSLSIKRAAFQTLQADVVKEGEVTDPVALGTTLKAFFAENDLPTRVRLGLANQRIVMRTVDLPPITDERQLASAIQFQAQEHIAMPLDQAILEHQSLGIVGTAEGPRSRVVLVAARREMVERLLEATRLAGLRVEGVDLAAFALIRALHRSADGEAQIAYINVGSMTNLAVAAETQCVFTRVMMVGFDTMVADLSARRGLTTEHSQGWLRHVGLLQPIEAVEGQPEIIRDAREVLQNGVSQIAAEVRSTLTFYEAQTGGALTQRAVLTGAGSSIEGFADQLARELGIPVEIRVVPEGQAGSTSTMDPAQLTIAAGLTATEVPA